MNITIKYCGEWNYRPEAARVEAEITRELEASVTLDRGGGGVFKVWVDGELIYDKARTGSFPRPGEVNRLLKDRGPKG